MIIVYNTGHYAARLTIAGIDVALAEEDVAVAISAHNATMAKGVDFVGRLHTNGVLIEFRGRMQADGTITVGTIFPVQ